MADNKDNNGWWFWGPRNSTPATDGADPAADVTKPNGGGVKSGVDTQQSRQHQPSNTGHPGNGARPQPLSTGQPASAGRPQPLSTGQPASAEQPTSQEHPSYSYQPAPDRPLNPHSCSPRLQSLPNFRMPRVFISPEAYKRMQLYIELARKEVGWLGTCMRLENGDFFIDQTYLLEQEVTPTETELSVEGQNKLVNQLLVDGDEGLERVNRMRFWGHSHVRMGTSPSGTDERTMDRWQSEGLPWAVRGIFNKLGRAEFTVYLYEDGYRICDAPWAVMDLRTKRVIMAPRGGGLYQRPSSYDESRGWWGGPERAHDSSYRGGSYGTGFYRDEFSVPQELQADEAMRNEITAEFAAKVSERLLVLSGWFNREKDQHRDTDRRQSLDTADGAPAGVDTDDRCPGPKGEQSPAIAEQPGNGWSFWRWLGDLLSGDGTGSCVKPDSTAHGGTKPPSDGSKKQ